MDSKTSQSSPAVNHLGGSMYGDGEIVVSFESAHSNHAPLRATAYHRETARLYEAGPYAHGTKPSVKLATEIIAEVRDDLARIPEELR